MSQENVKVVQGMYAAFAKGDIPSVLAALDGDVEWWEAEKLHLRRQEPLYRT